MSILILLVALGVALAMAGNYRARIRALEKNPASRVRIIPRTMYDDVMGVDWVSEAK
jgi:hypothetical protein